MPNQSDPTPTIPTDASTSITDTLDYTVMGQAGNRCRGTLEQALTTSSDTIVIVEDTSGFPEYAVFTIDDERMLCGPKDGTGNSYPVIQRAFDGSTADAHVTGSTVEIRNVAYAINRLINEVGAVQSRMKNVEADHLDRFLHADGSVDSSGFQRFDFGIATPNIQNNGFTLTVPATGNSVLATRDLVETLNNKTLVTPNISSILNTGTLTLPTSTDTLVGRDTVDTLTNKTIGGSNNVTASSLKTVGGVYSVASSTSTTLGHVLTITNTGRADFTALPAQAVTGASNIGSSAANTSGVFASLSGQTLQFKRLKGSGDVTISDDGATVTISSGAGGGGALTVAGINGTPVSVSTVTTLQFDQADGFIVSDETGGVSKVKFSSAGTSSFNATGRWVSANSANMLSTADSTTKGFYNTHYVSGGSTATYPPVTGENWIVLPPGNASTEYHAPTTQGHTFTVGAVNPLVLSEAFVAAWVPVGLVTQASDPVTIGGGSLYTKMSSGVAHLFYMPSDGVPVQLTPLATGGGGGGGGSGTVNTGTAGAIAYYATTGTAVDDSTWSISGGTITRTTAASSAINGTNSLSLTATGNSGVVIGSGRIVFLDPVWMFGMENAGLPTVAGALSRSGNDLYWHNGSTATKLNDQSSGGGSVTGSGTANRITMWSGTSSLTNAPLTAAGNDLFMSGAGILFPGTGGINMGNASITQLNSTTSLDHGNSIEFPASNSSMKMYMATIGGVLYLMVTGKDAGGATFKRGIKINNGADV